MTVLCMHVHWNLVNKWLFDLVKILIICRMIFNRKICKSLICKILQQKKLTQLNNILTTADPKFRNKFRYRTNLTLRIVCF